MNFKCKSCNLVIVCAIVILRSHFVHLHDYSFGKPVHDRLTSFDIHVADLFPETNSKINYIALIQDNDENPYLGESVYSQVQLVNQALASNAASRPYQTGVDNDPASPRSHVNFGSLDVPNPDTFQAVKCDLTTVSRKESEKLRRCQVRSKYKYKIYLHDL